MTPALVIFDMDGTIVDSQSTIVGAMSACFAAKDLPPPSREDVLGVIGMSLPQALAHLARAESKAAISEMVEIYKTAYRARLAEGGPSEPYAGALDLLRRLAARDEILLGVATGKSRRGLDRALTELSLDRVFVTTQSADEHPSKPHPSMIEAALAETGVDTDRAVMVGDTTFDVEMAATAGVSAIGVTWGYHPADALRASGASAIVDDFAALEIEVDRFVGATI